MLSALSFLTVFGRASVPDRSTLTWFPVAGALIGAVLGGVWWGAAQIWPPMVVGALVLLADLLITGMLHLDGLADAADGLLPHLDHDRRLAVMAEPTIGAFALGAVVVVLALRWACFVSIEPNVALLAALWCMARTLMAVAVRALPYGRPEGGLATAFGGAGGWQVVAALGLAASLGLGFLADGGPGIAAVLGAVAAGAAVLALGVRRLGGYTGDLLGAAGVVAETAGLVAAAARW